MTGRFLHYSDKPLTHIRSVDQRGIGPKPDGLWFSVEGEDDWKHWCETERYSLQHLAFAHELRITSDANLLWLRGASSIDLFHIEYSERPYKKSFAPRYINWSRVAEKYQGIVIAPYCWSRRLDGPAHDWYYGWDCASGCVWDASAVLGIVPQPLANAAVIA